MDRPEDHLAEVQWSQEGDAWIGVLGASGKADVSAGTAGHDGLEVELMLQAEDWHIEVSHGAAGGFEREHVLAADAEGARAEGSLTPAIVAFPRAASRARAAPPQRRRAADDALL